MPPFTNSEITALLEDIAAADALDIPGFARQQWVIASQIIRSRQSPPPVWIYLLTVALEKLIPLIVSWLQNHYGDEWPQKLRNLLKEKKLPWQGSKQPTSPSESQAPSAE